MKKSDLRKKNSLSINEIVSIGWATIGGRVEDYAKLLVNFPKTGFQKCFNAINKDYKEDSIEVFIGVYVYVNFGTDTYYKGVSALQVSDEYQLFKKHWNRLADLGSTPDDQNPLFIFNTIPDSLLIKLINNTYDVKQLLLLEADSRRLSM